MKRIIFRHGFDNLRQRWYKERLRQVIDLRLVKGITNFVSTGPKSYSFKYGDDEEMSAIKGFTLNHENSSSLNHNSMSKIVRK